jgi:predicted RNase H-like nuclease (RuvC/YqgF family)
MADQNSIQDVRDRLTGLLADWGAELSAVLQELEAKRIRVAELEEGAAGRHHELDSLKQRVEGQQTLIEALRGDAEDSSKLREEVRSRDLELERVMSELEAKKDLVRALRRDVDSVERVKTDGKA